LIDDEILTEKDLHPEATQRESLLVAAEFLELFERNRSSMLRIQNIVAKGAARV